MVSLRSFGYSLVRYYGEINQRWMGKSLMDSWAEISGVVVYYVMAQNGGDYTR